MNTTTVQSKPRPARMTTGVTADCPCGATGVPMAWGSGQRGTVKLYKHVAGKPYAGKSARGSKCAGPADLFGYLLAAWGLALFQCDDGRVRRLTLEGVNEDKVRELIASERRSAC